MASAIGRDSANSMRRRLLAGLGSSTALSLLGTDGAVAAPKYDHEGNPDGLIVYDAWHDAVRQHDIAAMAALYTDDAILETPLAMVIDPSARSGRMVGRAAIRAFLEASLRRFPNDLSQWYRTGVFFANGRRLSWEYPRLTPVGEQADRMEMMEIKRGLISAHRVYYGWHGVQVLMSAWPVRTADVSAPAASSRP